MRTNVLINYMRTKNDNQMIMNINQYARVATATKWKLNLMKMNFGRGI